MTRQLSFPIDAAHVMMFGRAVEIEPVEGARPGRSDGDLAVPVHPTFTESLQHFIPEYKWRPLAGRAWPGSGREPGGVVEGADGPNIMHAEQRFEYYRPIHAGETLVGTTDIGKEWEKVNRSGVVLRFREIVTEFRDDAGRLVVTSVAVEVEVPRSTGDQR